MEKENAIVKAEQNKSWYLESWFQNENTEYKIQGKGTELNTIIISQLLSRNNVSSEFVIHLLTIEWTLHLNNIKLNKGEIIRLDQVTPTQFELSIWTKVYTIDTVQKSIIKID